MGDSYVDVIYNGKRVAMGYSRYRKLLASGNNIELAGYTEKKEEKKEYKPRGRRDKAERENR
jgi:hypothetical protein